MKYEAIFIAAEIYLLCVLIISPLCINGEEPLELIDITKVNKSSIVPEPNNVTYGEELVYLYPTSFKIIIKSEGVNEVLQRGVERFQSLYFPFEGLENPKTTTETSPFISIDLGRNYLNTLNIYVRNDSQHLGLETNETYELQLIADSTLVEEISQLPNPELLEYRAFLYAETAFGALKGLETFYQLIQFHRIEHDITTITTGETQRIVSHIYFINGAPLSIFDSPRFPWRGLMIDTARHYEPVENILLHIDAMATVKLNVFHWHMTDTESFPFDSHLWPNLTAGAWGPKEIYTYKDIQEIIGYAYDRGIRVIPEFDLPGHCKAWSTAYPNFIVECSDTHIMNPFYSLSYPIIEGIYGEVSSLFPDGYFHIGADETGGIKCWDHDPVIHSNMSQAGYTSTSLLQHVNMKLINYALQFSNIPIAWEEILANNPPNMTIIQAWRAWGDDAYITSMNKGYKTLLSTSWYLDWEKEWDYYYSVNKDRLVHANDHPTLALGGEACLWAERVDQSNFASKIWPSTAAIAENLWTTHPNYADARPIKNNARIEAWRCKAMLRGIGSRPLFPDHCEIPIVNLPNPLEELLEFQDPEVIQTIISSEINTPHNELHQNRLLLLVITVIFILGIAIGYIIKSRMHNTQHLSAVVCCVMLIIIIALSSLNSSFFRII